MRTFPDYSAAALLRDPEDYERRQRAQARLHDAAQDMADAIRAHLALCDSHDVITAERVNANTAAFRAALVKAGL